MAEITVNKKTIKEYLSQSQKNRFVIPEYQREYAWTVDECQTLWDDIESFFESAETEYFIGTVVTFKNEDEESEIIDGQQRTITLFLILRAIYTKLKELNADNVKKLIADIENCLWKIDPFSGDPNFGAANIDSRSATDLDIKIFEGILATGKQNNLSTNFEKNYEFFRGKIDERAQKQPTTWYEFVSMILEKLILMPIEADNQDNALTIFNTLNNRGLSLSDADIFKSQIYKTLPLSEREEFIEKWKMLSKQISQSMFTSSIDQLFYCYMMYLRAKNGDTDTTIPKMRRYYSKNDFELLKNSSLFEDILALASFFEYVEKLDGEEEWKKEFSINKYIDILRNFPNEWWKYPVCTYYLTYKERPDFKFKFQKFIEDFTRALLSKFVENSTVSNIKGLVLDINKQIYLEEEFRRNQKLDKDAILRNLKKTWIGYNKFVKDLLLLHAYLNEGQTKILEEGLEIEHILPKKNSGILSPGEASQIEAFVELLGNKVLLEKIPNIKASNEYFMNKKKYYADSKVNLVQQLSNKIQDGFSRSDIEARQSEVEEKLITFFKI